MKRLLITGLVGACLAFGAAHAQNVGTELDALTARVEKLEGTRAVKKLQRAFAYYVDRGLWGEAADLFAADGTLEIGLDGVYVGPSDLALSLGLPPTLEVTEDEHVEAVERIREACHEHGIAAGIHSPSGEWARRHTEAGFDLVTVATDAPLLREAALRQLTAARAERT